MTRRGWAIVTGASGGMGVAFVKSLAKRGYSVLAVARRVEPLVRMAEELKKHGAFVETLAVDLASAEGVKTVVERAHALGNIELLVNNAGLSTSGHFLNQSADKEIQSIRVNVELTPRFILRWLMARMFAPITAAAGSSGPPKRRSDVA